MTIVCEEKIIFLKKITLDGYTLNKTKKKIRFKGQDTNFFFKIIIIVIYLDTV